MMGSLTFWEPGVPNLEGYPPFFGQRVSGKAGNLIFLCQLARPKKHFCDILMPCASVKCPYAAVTRAFLGQKGNLGPLLADVGLFQPQTALIRPTRSLCWPKSVMWPGRIFFGSREHFIGLFCSDRDIFRPKMPLYWPDRPCVAMRGPSFGLRAPLSSQEGILSD